MASEDYAIGIDLGTTYSCVAVWRHERAEIIANDQGNRTTPSIVAFTGEERLVGDSALNQAARNSENTIYGVKRMMGRHFSDDELQKDTKYWPFKVINSEGNPAVEVQYMGETKTFTPVEISAMILAKMKQTAELKLGPVKKAVITVPAYFNNAQRQSTLDAGKIAGLDVLRVFTEPTAAALAYGIDARKSKSNTILVFDLGGGTFDVSLLKIEDSKFVVKATSGDSHLGGEDFDNALVEHCVQVFNSKFGHDISNNAKALRRLKTNCEKAKRTLSSTALVHIEVDSLYDGVDFSLPLTRAKFESLCQEQFNLTMKAVNAILSDAKLAPSDIDEVVLSGGSSRIPKVQKMLSDFFGGKEINTAINLDEAVASGAAIQAALLAGNMNSEMNALVLVDVTPLSLGIRVDDLDMSNVIDRNTSLPVTISKKYTTKYDYQKKILFSVYEGESICTKNNLLLGEFTVQDIQIDKAGVPKIDVTFNLNLDGILTVTARDRVTHSTNKIVITGYKGRFSKDQIDGMIESAKRLDAQDKLALESQLAKLDLEAEYRNPPKRTDYTQASKLRSFYNQIWVRAFSWAGDSYDSS